MLSEEDTAKFISFTSSIQRHEFYAKKFATPVSHSIAVKYFNKTRKLMKKKFSYFLQIGLRRIIMNYLEYFNLMIR